MDLISELLNHVRSGLRWIESKLIELGTQIQQSIFLKPIRGQSVLILIKFFCLQSIFLPLSFFSNFHARFLWRQFPYIVSPIHLSHPPVQFPRNPLDACPIKAFLEIIGRVVSWENTVHVSFLHKYGQFSGYSAFNVVIAVTFLLLIQLSYFP